MTHLNDNFLVTAKGHSFQLSGAVVQQLDITSLQKNAYHLLVNHQSVTAAIEAVSLQNKSIDVILDGELFTVTIKDELDQMLDKMGFGSSASKQIKEIKAPMPGLVLEINVQAGDAVTQGSKLLILEAMKMENSILIPVDATIKKVNVTKGQAVEKGQVLVKLE